MDANRRSDSPSHARGNPGWGFLVCATWYALVIAAFVGFVDRQPDIPPIGCSGTECFSDRFGWFMFGMLIGAPTVLLAFIVSLVILGVLATKSRIRSVVLLGTVAATPALLMLSALVILTQTR
jgi:hypothetical protein